MVAAVAPLVTSAAAVLKYLDTAYRGQAAVLAGDGRCVKTVLAQRVALRRLDAGGAGVAIDLRRDSPVGLGYAVPRASYGFGITVPLRYICWTRVCFRIWSGLLKPWQERS